MAWTEEQLKAAAKKAYAAGDMKSAQELFEQAKSLKSGTVNKGPTPDATSMAVPQQVTDAPEPKAFSQSEFAKSLSPEQKAELDTAGNPYAQEDTIYDPMTGMPIGGSFANTPMTTPMSALESLGVGAGQGVTLNFGDEITSALRAAFDPNKTYSDYQSEQQARLADAEASGGFGIGQFAGGLALPAGLGAKMVKAMPTTLTKMLAGGAGGAALGEVQGIGAGEGGLGERAVEAIPSALVGAGIGAAIPGASGLVQALMGRANKAGVADDLAKAGIKGVSPRAVDRLLPAYEGTHAPGGDVRAYLASLGDDAMIADIPGPLRQKSQGLAAMGGEGGARLGSAIEERAAGAGPRIQGVMDEQITGPNAAFDLLRANAAERTNVLGPEYQAALESGQTFDPVKIAETLDPNAVGSVKASQEGIREMLGLPKDAPGVLAPEPITADKLHNIRVQLSDQISEATRAGKGGFVAAMKPVLQAIDDKLDELPGYKEARAGYASNKAMDRAVESGAEALRGGRATAASPDEFRVLFGKLSDAEKDAFRAGMRRDIAALMGTSKNDAAAAWGEFAKGWNEEKLRIALGDGAEPIIRRLKAEKVFSETRGVVTQGSKTAATAEAKESLSAANPSGSSLDAGMLAPLKAFNQYVVDPAFFGPRRSALNSEIGAALAARGGDAQKLLEIFAREKAKRAAGTPGADLVNALLQRAGRGAMAAAQ